MRYFSILAFLILLFSLSCRNKRPIVNNSTIIIDSTQHRPASIQSKDHPFFPSPIDSLNKYQGSNVLLSYNNKTFYVGKANGIDFGIIPIRDSAYEVFNKVNDSWLIADTFFYSKIKYVDIKLFPESNEKLVVINSSEPANKNRMSEGEVDLILDSSKKRFISNHCLILYNVVKVPEKKDSTK